MAQDIKCDQIDENTTDAGVTIEQVQLTDSHIVLKEITAQGVADTDTTRLYSKEDKELHIKGDDSVEKKLYSIPSGSFKSVFFEAPFDSFKLYFKTKVIVTDGQERFTFKIPSDFVSLYKLCLIGIVSSGAAGTGKDIDLYSSYGAAGEDYNAHTESDTATTYNFLGKTDKLVEINISSVFSSVSKDDYCGLRIVHNTIGGDIDYLGILLEYL
jgi:hypothetical protein